MAFVLLTNVAFAQDTVKNTPRINELSLSLNNISPISIGIDYKRQIGTKTFFKLGFVNLSATNKANDNYYSTFKRTVSDYSAGLSIGLEFRTPINDRVSFFHGPNLSYSYYNFKEDIIDPNEFNSSAVARQSHYISLPYNFGFLFQIRNHFFIGLQANSSVGVSFIDASYKFPDLSPRKNYDEKSINYDFSIVNTNGFLNFVYRF